MESTDQLELRHVLPFGQHHAFIIGIDKYEQVSPLQTAVSDASKLAEVLATQQHFCVHPPLLNAKGEEIRNLLQKTLLEKVGKDDRVLFYFAGHGIAADGEDGPAGYIVPADADPTDVKTFIPMEDLHKKLDELPCRHLLLILDCCFSGAFKWSSNFRAIGTLMPKRIYKERFDYFIHDPAWQVITSAAYDQKALDVLQGKAPDTRGVRMTSHHENTPHSPFALALFEGLSGAADIKIEQEGDGVITATELYAYIRAQIEPATIQESQKLRQTPGFFPLRKHDKGEFIFLHPRHRLNLPPIPKRSPYKGLQSFDEADRELFYGRDRVIKELRAKTERNKLLVITGASGTGKSSVIKAGLLPVLREEGFRILPVIRPGINPVGSLEKGLKDANVIEVSASLQDGAFIAKLGASKTVLLIDQYEELITRCNNPAKREQFVTLLREMLDKTPEDALKIILTVRADFEPQLNDGDLKKYWLQGRCTVPPFSIEELKEVIVMPTIQEVLIFEPPELVDNIIEEVVQSPGALPLLSYTLSELYEAYRNSGRQDRALKKENYAQLGGVMGALCTKADNLYNALDLNHQNTMHKIMLRMVSLEGELAGKRVMMDELIYADAAENQRVEAVIQQLVDARLIVKGKDYIEPAHDALVRAWKTLDGWMQTVGREKIVLQNRLKEQVQEYERLKQDENVLWDNDPRLELMKRELTNPHQWFNGKEIDFIQKSVQRKEKRRRILWSTIAAVFIALLALTGWALWSRSQAVLNAKKDRAGRLAIEAKDVLKTDHTKALRLAEASYAILEDDPPVSAQQILSEAFHTLHDSIAFYAANLQHAGEVTAAVFSPKRDRILTASMDSTAILWNLQGNPLDTLEHPEAVNWADFSPSGKRIITATIDGAVWLWDSTGALLDTIKHGEKISSAVFSPNEELILIASEGDTARLWNLQGNLRAKLPHQNEVFSAVFDSAGRKILTAAADRTAKLWDLQGNLLKTVQHDKQVNEAIFSPDGEKILTASRDKTAKLWDLRGKPLATFAHRSEVFSAVFAPDGLSVLTASADSTAKLWNLRGELLATFEKRHKVTKAVFSPVGKKILTASKNHTATLWNRHGERAGNFAHANEVTRVAFSSDEAYILTASKDSTAKLWDLRELRLQRINQPANWAAFSPNGERLLSLSDDHVARLWDLRGSLIDSLQLEHQITDAFFSPQGERVLTLAEDHIARLWNPQGRFIDSLAHDHAIRSADFSPNGREVLTVDIADNAQLWELPKHASDQPTAKPLGQMGSVKAAVFSPNGRKILTAATDGFARILDNKGRLIDSLAHGGVEVSLALFTPKSEQILTAAVDGFTRVWNNKGKLSDSLNTGKVSKLVISPDEKRAVTILSDGTVNLCELQEKSFIRLAHDAEVHLAVFSPDGRQILTAAIDGIAKLWNLQGKLLAKLDKHHHAEIKTAVFSPNGRNILTAALDNTVKLWWTPQAIYDWLKQANISRLTEKEKEAFGIEGAN